VAACYLPFDGGAVAALRLLRLMRVLKIFHSIQELQVILAGLAQGMGSVFYIALLMFLLFYVFGIMSIILFRGNDPAHFSSLHDTFITLFRIATMEDWTDVMYVGMYGCDKYRYGNMHDQFKCENPEEYGMWAAVYWIIFVMFSSMIMLNLVVGVVCSAMSQATEDHKERKAKFQMMDRLAVQYNVPRSVLDSWAAGFVKLDDSNGYASGNIRREDLNLMLLVLGETELLTKKRCVLQTWHGLSVRECTLTCFFVVHPIAASICLCARTIRSHWE
jgi:hypothetical protein